MASAAIISATPSSSSRKTFSPPLYSSTAAAGSIRSPCSLKRPREDIHKYKNNVNYNNDRIMTRMGIDSENDTLLSSQSKRQKVSFDTAVEVRVLEPWDEKSYEHVREEVKQMIRWKADGRNSARLCVITELFAETGKARDARRANEMDDRDDGDEEDAPPSSSLLRKYLLALTGHVGALNREYSGLVYAIIDHRWWDRDGGFVNAYVRFLGSLVSAQSGYISSVMKMLVKRFLEASSFASIFGSLEKQMEGDKTQAVDDVHRAIRYILDLSPVACRSLASTLSSSYPFETEKTRIHVRYVRNLLKLVSYAPELRGDVLALVSEKLVKIDVQIQVEMDDLDEDKEDELLHQIATADVEDAEMDDEASDDESVVSDDSDDSSDGRVQLLKDNLIKLDSLMAVLFDYYTTVFSEANEMQVEDTFEQLLSSFTNAILPTYRSRHIQFLIFHFAQGSTDFIERLVGALAQVTFDKARPGLIQQAGAAYLASFVARGMHVPADMVQNVVAFLGSQLDKLRELHEPGVRGPDLRKYGSYYATAQAILYIFCFRWQDLIIQKDGSAIDEDEVFYGEKDFDWVSNIKGVLNRNIYSRLNPLKVCSPAIVTQFAHVARQLRFMYVFPLLESNKRVRLAHIFGTSSEFRARNESGVSFGSKISDSMYQLDAYFPFDPYQLPKSKKWIEGDYKEWKSLADDGTHQAEDIRNDGGVSSDAVDEEDEDEEMANGLLHSDSDSD